MKKLILFLVVAFSLCWCLNSIGYYGNFTGSGADLPSDTVYMYVTVFDTLGLSRGSCKQDPEVWFKRWYGATYIDSTAGTQIIRGADSSLFYAKVLAKSGTRYGQYNVEIGWRICPTATGKVFTKNESYTVMDTFPISRAGYSLSDAAYNALGDTTKSKVWRADTSLGSIAGRMGNYLKWGWWIVAESLAYVNTNGDSTVRVNFDSSRGTIGNTQLEDNVITAAKIAADAIGSSELASTAKDEIVDQTWDEAITDHNSGSNAFGDFLWNRIDGVMSIVVRAQTADALFDSGYTISRSAKLDYLDEAISGIDDNPWDNGTRNLTALGFDFSAGDFDTTYWADLAIHSDSGATMALADSSAGDISYIANTPNDYKATGFLTQALFEADSTYVDLRDVVDGISKYLGARDGDYQWLRPFSSANKDSVPIFNKLDVQVGTLYYFHTGSIIDSLRFEKW